MKPKTIGERIRHARLHPKTGDGKKLSFEHVGKNIGKSHSLVKNWEDGKSVPKSRDLFIFSRLTGYSVYWLQEGVEDSIPNDNVEILGEVGRLVPRVELADIGPYLSGDESVASGKAFTHRAYGPRAFQTVIRDRSNWPRLEPGDGLVIDPDVAPEAEDFCLALHKGRYIVRQFIDRDGHVELAPVNDAFSKTVASHDDIVGRVMEFSRQI